MEYKRKSSFAVFSIFHELKMSVPVEWAVLSLASSSATTSGEAQDEYGFGRANPARLVYTPQDVVDVPFDLFKDLRYVEGCRGVYAAGRRCTSYTFSSWLRVQLSRQVGCDRFLDSFQRAVVMLSVRLKSLYERSGDISRERSSSKRYALAIATGEKLWNSFVEMLSIASVGIPTGDVYDDRRLFMQAASSLVRPEGRFGGFSGEVRGWNRGCAMLLMGFCPDDGPFL